LRHPLVPLLSLLCASVLADPALAQNPTIAPSEAVVPAALGAPPPQGRPLATGVILVKGAEASASDRVTPIPESGTVSAKGYRSDYFGLAYSIPEGWAQRFQGPPPSDRGNYVLAQIRTPKGAPVGGNILITAQDLFFTLAPASSPAEMVAFIKKTLPDDYKTEQAPSELTLAGHRFARFDYMSPVAQLHWTVLATEIRCHTVQFIFSSSDTALINRLVAAVGTMTMPGSLSGTGGGATPVCVADYALGDHVLSRPDPSVVQRFNPIPVRVIIGKNGHVQHVHVISAFPEQAAAIQDALRKWTFKPYLQDGQPIDIETGIMFGTGPSRKGAPTANLKN
jgi:hypothetical protein